MFFLSFEGQKVPPECPRKCYQKIIFVIDIKTNDIGKGLSIVLKRIHKDDWDTKKIQIKSQFWVLIFVCGNNKWSNNIIIFSIVRVFQTFESIIFQILNHLGTNNGFAQSIRYTFNGFTFP